MSNAEAKSPFQNQTEGVIGEIDCHTHHFMSHIHTPNGASGNSVPSMLLN